MKTLFIAFTLCCGLTHVCAQEVRQKLMLNNDWLFSLGDAGDMQKDFTHGTEYFTYLTKAASSGGNKGPASPQFADSAWQQVSLPHDWVVDLPYSGEASHSHGYKTIGWKYPQNSVGWYRRSFHIPQSDKGRHIAVRFDGIFRDAQVFCNGFYLGHEPSGYATQVYNLTEYLNYGGENTLTVRADASTEEGWFYEGAGIYRHVWLLKSAPLHVKEFGTFVTATIDTSGKHAVLSVATEVVNDGLIPASFSVTQRLTDAAGREVAQSTSSPCRLIPKDDTTLQHILTVSNPTLWEINSPYLYTLHTDVYSDGKLTDSYPTTVGIRSIRFDADQGFFLNGKPVKLKGTNLHQDHAGVGAAIPDELWRYRITKLKEMGSNAIRCSHNPASPAMLDLCDRMGMLVIAENRLMGVNKEHNDLLQRMIERDRNHPSIILWSIGNEEWAIEGNEKGRDIARSMTAFVHRIDSTRPSSYGNSGGRILQEGVDVQGYNYIVQNDVEGLRQQFPDRKAYGSEETTGSGTRGIYFTDQTKGRMASINREGVKGVFNVIARGWNFYNERPWLGGVFYWTGLDYRGEPNSLSYPATGSQFGILDYCGFSKDEAYYLQSWWTDQPTLHIFPHWNLTGHEGDSISVWIYSNCDEVELTVNGKRLGRKAMPHGGYLSWETIYRPGKVTAIGYTDDKRVLRRTVETTGVATQCSVKLHKPTLKADGQDVVVADITLLDKQEREVPDAMNDLTVRVSGQAVILGYGNGDSAFREIERPVGDERQTMKIKAFNGKAQLLIRSIQADTEEAVQEATWHVDVELMK
ncbi:MAG: DUF4982 domain-containing protein [Mediterranea sp.]|jgi:beta-galactosidase|nr:DUF4982 domain-containing protein [Mediterranea sp.]